MNEMTIPDDSRDLTNLSDQQLIDIILEGLQLTVRGVCMAAQAVGILESRGRDLSELKLSFYHALRKVASKTLEPEAFIRFAGKRTILDRVSGLPISDQRRLAKGEPVKLLVYAEGGERTIRMADPLEMLPKQIAQVFASDHIRNEAEQALILDQRREDAVTRRRPEVEKVGKARVDRVAKIVRVGNHTFTFDDWRTVARMLGE